MLIAATLTATAATAMVAGPTIQAQDREWPGRAFITKDSCVIAGPVPGGIYEGQGFQVVGASAAPQGTVNVFVTCHTDQVAGPEVDQAFQARDFPCFIFGVPAERSQVIVSPGGRATVICHTSRFDIPE